VADIQIVDRLEDVARADWDRLVGNDGFYLSYDWLRFVESEPVISARYLLAYESGALCGALPLYRPLSQGFSRYLPAHFAGLLGLTGDYLVAGGIRGYRSALLVVPDRRGDGDPLAALLEAAAAVAAEEGYAGVVLPCLSTSALLDVARVTEVRAAFEAAEAEFTGCGEGLQSYIARVRRSARMKIRADRARFIAAGWQVKVLSLDECWREAARLLTVLEHKYDRPSRPDGQLERTLAGQAKLLSRSSLVFACVDDQEIVGLALLYRWRSTLYERLVGFDYGRLRDAREYFNLAFHEPIAYCQNHDLDRVHVGIGTWEAKGFRGAFMRPLWTAAMSAGTAPARPGLELVGTGEQQMTELAWRHISHDPAEWVAPEKFAAEAVDGSRGR
jgi:uncharacterized protein